MSLIRAWLAPLVLALAMAAVPAACGGSQTYRLPVDSQLKPFVKPDADDLVSTDDDSDYEDMGDTSTAGAGDAATHTGTETPAKAPAAPAGSSAKTPAPASAGAGSAKSTRMAKSARTSAGHSAPARSK